MAARAARCAGARRGATAPRPSARPGSPAAVRRRGPRLPTARARTARPSHRRQSRPCGHATARRRGTGQGSATTRAPRRPVRPPATTTALRSATASLRVCVRRPARYGSRARSCVQCLRPAADSPGSHTRSAGSRRLPPAASEAARGCRRSPPSRADGAPRNARCCSSGTAWRGWRQWPAARPPPGRGSCRPSAARSRARSGRLVPKHSRPDRGAQRLPEEPRAQDPGERTRAAARRRSSPSCR